ncbi:MAG: hypothetical protein KA484_07500 [Rhodocyclaceae bacterium]|nr:hypothetical protein [Rhodocyclaceae bacterium]
MFQLNAVEKAEVVANCDHLAKLKFSKSLPFVFTEHVAIQASNMLGSPQAVEMGVPSCANEKCSVPIAIWPPNLMR